MFLLLERASQVVLVVKNLPANAGDTYSIPGSGKSPGVRNGNLLQCSCLENSMDRKAWWATVRGVAKSQTWLKQLSMHITWKAKNQKTNPKSLAVLGKTYFAFHPHLLLSELDLVVLHSGIHVGGTCFFICKRLSVSSTSQSCLTLCDHVDCSTPGFPVHRHYKVL